MSENATIWEHWVITAKERVIIFRCYLHFGRKSEHANDCIDVNSKVDYFIDVATSKGRFNYSILRISIMKSWNLANFSMKMRF